MFNTVRQKMQTLFDQMKKEPLFKLDINGDKAWAEYLGAFAEDVRQSNNCNCCKQFIRQYGGLCCLQGNKIVSIWDIELSDEEVEYQLSFAAMRKLVKGAKIASVFLNESKKAGTEKNFDSARNIEWNHLYLELPNTAVERKDKIPTILGDKNTTHSVFKDGLSKITLDAVETVDELIKQGSLYKGSDQAYPVTNFLKLKKEYDSIKNVKERENFTWRALKNNADSILRIKNTSVGTLLLDIASGRELDEAVDAYGRIVSPLNYKRTTSLVTPRMVEMARQKLEELGLTDSLFRKTLSANDLSVEDALFVHRKTDSANIFDQISQEVLVSPKSLSKVEEIGIEKFLADVLPKAKNVKVLVENSHLGNFAALIGSKNDEHESLFKWGNNKSWSYTGGLADSMKEKVKNAGGKVDGYVRVSLAWNNHDDLDLHLQHPNGHVTYFANRSREMEGAQLDVDMNAGLGNTKTPVENICFPRKPKDGKYTVIVNQYSRRSQSDNSFGVEVEVNGQLFEFAGINPTSGSKTICQFTMKNGEITMHGDHAGKTRQVEKWGVKTNQWLQVSAICLSPNHWGYNQGEKHYMFMLDGCRADEEIRPFYNTFLKPELYENRKVFETLASKATIERTDNELCGVAFSDTIRNHMYVEVDGKFKRILKVTI